MLYKTEGIVIKKQAQGEFDNLLTVYTKDFGKLMLKAKSVRKPRAKLSGHLEPFLYTYFLIAPSRRLDIIANAEIIEGFPVLRGRLTSLAAASYFSELADKLIAGTEPDRRMWDLLLFSLRRLDANEDIKSTVRFFEQKLLELLGYGFDVRRDVVRFAESLTRTSINSKRLLTELL